MTNTLNAPTSSSDPVVHRATTAARSVARSSGIEIREIDATHDLDAVSRLLSTIWNREAKTPQMTVELLKALSKTGNYVAGTFRDGELVGAAVAFFAEPALASLHSHIAGVTGESRARSVGYSLKLHQRAWALGRGISKITWTFDPLVRRNAYFNIAKLGARAVEYLPDFYGEMRDPVNAGDRSDRLLVEWDLLAHDVVAACDAPGAPVQDPFAHRIGTALDTVLDTGPGRVLDIRPDTVLDIMLDIAPDGTPRPGRRRGPLAVVVVPPDIERLRADRPPLAAEWRLVVREVLGNAMAHGARVVGFRRTQGYIVADDRPVDPYDAREAGAQP